MGNRNREPHVALRPASGVLSHVGRQDGDRRLSLLTRRMSAQRALSHSDREVTSTAWGSEALDLGRTMRYAVSDVHLAHPSRPIPVIWLFRQDDVLGCHLAILNPHS